MVRPSTRYLFEASYEAVINLYLNIYIKFTTILYIYSIARSTLKKELCCNLREPWQLNIAASDKTLPELCTVDWYMSIEEEPDKSSVKRLCDVTKES